MNFLLDNTALEEDSVAREVREGLSAKPKRLPSKYFYDQQGSALFELICEQPEYYLTRTEIDIMQTHGADMGRTIGPAVRLVEFGSGAGIKTRLLLGHLPSPCAYVPVDISAAPLMASVQALAVAFPSLQVMPVVGDFTQALNLPRPRASMSRTVVYFPGSTLGNFEHDEALAILGHMRAEAGRRGGALIGIDLVKGVPELEAAYNDQAGVTAAFTLNMLTHLNHLVGTDFDVAAFAHRAVYCEARSRIETHVVSLRDQTVRLGRSRFEFQQGEALCVEYSHKYALTEFGRFAAQAGFHMSRCWTDAARRFAVVYLDAVPLAHAPSP